MSRTDTADPDALASAPGHPSPHRHRVSVFWIMLALIGPPLAWSLQISAGYALAAYACYPKRDALPAPILPHLYASLTVLSVVAIVMTVLCGIIAWHNWQRSRNEAAGDHHHLAEVGEGRSRFMSLCALIVSVGFAAALVVTGAVLLIVSPCGL
jgi:hypothetical protein